MKFGCTICIFLNSENLICRSTDISKCFRGSLQLRDNESRLYLFEKIWCFCWKCFSFLCHLKIDKAWHLRLFPCCGTKDVICQLPWQLRVYTGPGCSKLTTSLVNVSLKFQTLISQICQYFLSKKCEKLLQCKSFSHFFNKKYHCIWL